ncbi:MAG: 7-cyano-7-deazaguanine synthase QueC [Candidatus Omnitrophica bacterium]|nr:7-cyano-7-deazaguanine synthase QueC [Candidatus Omnitrophota bacterium]
MNKKAVVLLSGGLDSAVTLYYAKDKGYACYCLNFDYGQRHRTEIGRARSIAHMAGAEFTVISLPFSWKGSSLLDNSVDIPKGRTSAEINEEIPSTYVPARNTVFLSIAASFAEAIGAEALFIGAHSQDSSGYPDCRKEYLEAIDKAIRLGTKAGLEGNLKVESPLIDKTKKDIIELGAGLGVPFEYAWSCYAGGKKPCMECDSCILRAKGFAEAGVEDPLLKGVYANE